MNYSTQSAFGPMFSYQGNPSANVQYSEAQYPGHPGFGLQYLYAFQDRRPPLMPDHSTASDGKAESKPRLSKEEVDKLERIFQENPKPSSSVKAQLADELNLERPRINVSFACPDSRQHQTVLMMNGTRLTIFTWAELVSKSPGQGQARKEARGVRGAADGRERSEPGLNTNLS